MRWRSRGTGHRAGLAASSCCSSMSVSLSLSLALALSLSLSLSLSLPLPPSPSLLLLNIAARARPSHGCYSLPRRARTAIPTKFLFDRVFAWRTGNMIPLSPLVYEDRGQRSPVMQEDGVLQLGKKPAHEAVALVLCVCVGVGVGGQIQIQVRRVLSGAQDQAGDEPVTNQ